MKSIARAVRIVVPIDPQFIMGLEEDSKVCHDFLFLWTPNKGMLKVRRDDNTLFDLIRRDEGATVVGQEKLVPTRTSPHFEGIERIGKYTFPEDIKHIYQPKRREL
jgi:hypothetical protein